MGRSQETFNKKEVRNRKEKKRKEKAQKKLERQEKGKSSFDDMIAYVDEFGRITDTPPDPAKRKKNSLEDIQISTPKDDGSNKFDPIRTGTVSFFNDSKGYGFIRDAVTKESIFVHINNVQGNIKEGNRVTFETEKGPKGPTAVRVSIG